MAGAANAASVTKQFDWTYDGGYSMSGLFTYDDSVATVNANGGGATTGLEELSVSFFDAASTLLGTFDNVTAGVSSYSYLIFNFDTATMTFNSGTFFDVGADTGSSGEFYVYGQIGSSADLYEPPSFSSLDTTATGFNPDVSSVAAVPLPAFGGGLALALMGLGLVGRRRTGA